MSHFPAPWKFVASIYDEDDVLRFDKEVSYDYHSGDFCCNPSIVDADGNNVVGCGEYYVFSTPENVRLLVHAPELLDALKNLLAVMNGDGGTSPNAQETARQAIAKAEGTL